MDGWEDSPSNNRWKDSSAAKSTSRAGGGLAAVGQRMMSDSAAQSARSIGPVSYKKGGRVKRTGLAKLHRGEYVVPRNKVRKMKRAMRRSGR